MVGFVEQKIDPTELANAPIDIKSMHVKNFDLDYVGPAVNTHNMIYNYFQTET
jgi:hypothetical protein